MFSTFVTLPSWKLICRNINSLPSLRDESQSQSQPGWDYVWMHRLRMQTVLSSPALPCPLGGVSTVTLVSARAQLSSPGSCQSNPLLGAASPWQWGLSSRSSIDLDGLKLHRVSHFQPPFCPSLRKKNWRSCRNVLFHGSVQYWHFSGGSAGLL